MRIDSFLRQSPIFQTTRIARQMEAALNLALRLEEVNMLEALTLAAILFEKRGETKPSSLAEAFETTRGNMSHCISSLETKGLVERRIDAEDARAVQLTLTGQGRKRAARVVGVLDRMQRRFEEGIGAAKLASMLARMNAVAALGRG